MTTARECNCPPETRRCVHFDEGFVRLELFTFPDKWPGVFNWKVEAHYPNSPQRRRGMMAVVGTKGHYWTLEEANQIFAQEERALLGGEE